jgi:hypothetical protein
MNTLTTPKTVIWHSLKTKKMVNLKTIVTLIETATKQLMAVISPDDHSTLTFLYKLTNGVAMRSYG